MDGTGGGSDSVTEGGVRGNAKCQSQRRRKRGGRGRRRGTAGGGVDAGDPAARWHVARLNAAHPSGSASTC